MRAFISINIPNEIKKEIKNVQSQLPEFYGKKTELENLHLTLKFLGETDEQTIEKVKKLLEEIKLNKFQTKISEIGVFKEHFIKIIWLNLENCDELQKEIDESLKQLFKKEERFMSHLTIARVKYVKEKEKFLQELKKIKIPELKFEVNKFYLMKSRLTTNGPIYEKIKEFNLI